jgi:D-arabinose 1-dehydrogenase-like Zn-dependent alcohol dehydrogenase
MSSNRGARYVVVMLAGTAVGLVGCGAWGRFILRDLVSLGARVAVVARSEESKSRATEGGAHEVVRQRMCRHGRPISCDRSRGPAMGRRSG